MEKIDVRGLSCPQPVILVNRKIHQLGQGRIEVIGDLAAARDNIRRLASDKGWEIEDTDIEDDEYLLVLTK